MILFLISATAINTNTASLMKETISNIYNIAYDLDILIKAKETDRGDNENRFCPQLDKQWPAIVSLRA
jgi:hypothetical protein